MQELKVELSKADMKRLGRELGRDLTIRLPASKSERSVYFDTPAHHLYAAGLSLWLKRQDGHWLQTIKADRHNAEGISGPVQFAG